MPDKMRNSTRRDRPIKPISKFTYFITNELLNAGKYHINLSLFLKFNTSLVISPISGKIIHFLPTSVCM